MKEILSAGASPPPPPPPPRPPPTPKKTPRPPPPPPPRRLQESLATYNKHARRMHFSQIDGPGPELHADSTEQPN